MLGYDRMPSTLGRLGFTGYTVPPNGLPIRFHRIDRPTLPAFSLAPITATALGAKMAPSGPRELGRSCSSGSRDIIVGSLIAASGKVIALGTAQAAILVDRAICVHREAIGNRRRVALSAPDIMDYDGTGGCYVSNEEIVEPCPIAIQ